MRGNSHVRCGMGEKAEIISKPYLSLKAETLLYIALIGYIHYELLPERQNFATLIDMLDKMQVREDDEDFRNEIDDLFDDLAQRKPGHFAVRQYQKYKMASGDICSK